MLVEKAESYIVQESGTIKLNGKNHVAHAGDLLFFENAKRPDFDRCLAAYFFSEKLIDPRETIICPHCGKEVNKGGKRK